MPGAAIDQQHAARVSIDGRAMVSFAGCNYLGLAHHPRVLQAARTATAQYGLSTSASRETSGNTPIHEALESRVTAYVAGAGSALGLLVPDGYTANLAAAQGLAERYGRAVVDRRAHASLADSARCAGMSVEFFEHLDQEHLAATLRSSAAPAVVMTDGVFTTDGSVVPVPGWLETLRDGDALLVDDCHGLGVLGGGRGVCAHAGVDLATESGRLTYTSTLAKGIGGGGGIVIGSRELVRRMRSCAHAYVCTTPVSPLVAAGTIAALDVLEHEPDRVGRLAANARELHRTVGSEPAVTVPIWALPVVDHAEGERISQGLLNNGVFVPLMSYPGGPTPLYFRASVTSEHTAHEIARLGDLMDVLRGDADE